MSSVLSLELNNLNPASIKNLLDNSSVHVNWTGSRTLSGQYGSIQLDSIIERLKVISQQRIMSEDDQRNGYESVKKIRTFYRQSDWHPCAIVRSVYNIIVRIFELPLLLFGIYPQYSARDCIDVKANEFYSIGPTNISQNFKYHSNHPLLNSDLEIPNVENVRW